MNSHTTGQDSEQVERADLLGASPGVLGHGNDLQALRAIHTRDQIVPLVVVGVVIRAKHVRVRLALARSMKALHPVRLVDRTFTNCIRRGRGREKRHK